MAWRNTAAALKLRAQVDARWPKRDKRSDGTIGDTAHAARQSDHNPDRDGWVHALDIDADLDPGDRRAAEKLATDLINYARSGKPGSERIKYVVYANRIASGTYRDQFWTWRPGNWGHEHHLHVSFTDAAERDGSPFPLPSLLPASRPVVTWAGIKNGSVTQIRLVQAAIGAPVTGVWDTATRRAWMRTVASSRTSGGTSTLAYLGRRHGWRV
jgi:hypothetical protein